MEKFQWESFHPWNRDSRHKTKTKQVQVAATGLVTRATKDGAR